MRGRAVTAVEALQYGMVNEVVPAAQLVARTKEIAREIANVDPFMLRMIKIAVNGVEDSMGFTQTVHASHSHHMLTYFDGSTRATERDPDKRARVEVVDRALAAEGAPRDGGS